ncbi:unnamed protein product, partial [Brenthis ino]
MKLNRKCSCAFCAGTLNTLRAGLLVIDRYNNIQLIQRHYPYSSNTKYKKPNEYNETLEADDNEAYDECTDAVSKPNDHDDTDDMSLNSSPPPPRSSSASSSSCFESWRAPRNSLHQTNDDTMSTHLPMSPHVNKFVRVRLPSICQYK